jgi:hypothetical protein
MMSQDSVVSIATDYRLDYRGRISSPNRVKNFLHIVQTGSGVLSPGVKQQGSEADHSPPTSAKVKKMWMYTSTLPYAFMASA